VPTPTFVEVRLLLTLIAALALLTGCASGSPAPAPPQAAPTGTPLLWPVSTLEQAQTLQTEVDGGAQPWTLEPEEVAINYATATWGWTNPEPTTGTPGAVTLSDPQGTAALTLVQPVRAGTTGIWVVSAASRT
jgi:hypothetical protein